jgi:ribosomal protein S18 acetylase RimI-like enzyme
MRIEPATPDDCPAIAALQVLSWQHAYEGILPAPFLASLDAAPREAQWRGALSKGQPQLLVARSDGQVQGFIAYGPSRDADAPADRAEIWALYVTPAMWSQGVGRALWLSARDRLLDRGMRTVSLWVLTRNRRAILFYAKAGFAPEPRSARWFTMGGDEVQELRCVCRLDAGLNA